MNYVLQALVLQSNPALEIDSSEFELLKQARKALTAAFAIEEIYDLLLANFRELEVSALSAAVSDMTSFKTGYDEFFGGRSELNRRVLNLLSAARLYIDQFPQWLKEVGANSDGPRGRTRSIYDSSFEYRFMEALRNHVQHVGLAVHGVSMRSGWRPRTERKYLEFNIAPYSSKAALAADKGFKKGVLKECPETVDILLTARAYVGSIGQVHQEVRELVAPIVEQARSHFESAIGRHEQAASEQLPGLNALAREEGKTVESIPIFLKWDDVRIGLMNRNSILKNLGKRYVSSGARDDA